MKIKTYNRRTCTLTNRSPSPITHATACALFNPAIKRVYPNVIIKRSMMYTHNVTINRLHAADMVNPTAALYRALEGYDMAEVMYGTRLRGKTLTLPSRRA